MGLFLNEKEKKRKMVTTKMDKNKLDAKQKNTLC